MKRYSFTSFEEREICMSEVLVDICAKIVDGVFKTQNKPHVSTLIYILSGAIGAISGVSLIAPFHCSTGFLDAIAWDENLTDKSIIVQLAFMALLTYIAYVLIRSCLIHLYQVTPATKLRRIYVFLYTVDDVIDLASAVASLLFMISAFLQIYNTGLLFVSLRSIAIYTWIAIRTIYFVVKRFAYRNMKIINDIIKKYPDLY